MVKFIYVIAKGEFEITIKTLEPKKNEQETQQIVGLLRPKTNNIEASNTSCAAPVKPNQMLVRSQSIVVVGPGNMLGLEDIARITPHSYTAKCVS